VTRAAALLTAVASALVLVVATTPARAQGLPGCAAREPVSAVVAAAPIAFIGTVAALADEDREATVDVIRVWRGGPLPKVVHVRGNVATQAKVHTALDRTYAKGATYLFLPTAGRSPAFAETACSSTATLTTELAALAPQGGGDPPVGAVASAPSTRSATRFLPVAIGGAFFVGLCGLLLAARRRSRQLHAPADQRP
jgi:hypothetical protein